MEKHQTETSHYSMEGRGWRQWFSADAADPGVVRVMEGGASRRVRMPMIKFLDFLATARELGFKVAALYPDEAHG